MRRERDALGVKSVPTRALYGIFTQRARETFDLTRRPPHPALLRGYARVKKAAARANARLGLLPGRWARAIAGAADRIIAGREADAAVLDSLQAGAGTPTHMNVNEVIANLANERLGGRRGRYAPVHPNNHVNLGQSSNDVTPTAIRLMALDLLGPLDEELTRLAGAFRTLARRNRDVVKPGRTLCKTPSPSPSVRCSPVMPRVSGPPSARWRRTRASSASSVWGARPSAPASPPTPGFESW